MSRISVRAENVTKVFNSGNTGLHPCSFEVEANSLTAILGPSGCGKSTLIKALIGDETRTSGRIHIEGVELNEDNRDYIKTHIGYVPQDEIIHSDLTVGQCILYAARLRLSDYGLEQQNNRIQEVIKELGLEKIENQLIGQISGGQRKRVAIATEILTKPKVLFLDEPTSPLDPQTIGDFLKILRNLAKNGTTVLMVTHKPEDLEYMDECIFMGVGGYITYQGVPSKMVSYFGCKNIVEVYALMDSSAVGGFYSKSLGSMQELSIVESSNDNSEPL
jgi:ABC-type multidrug transport system ATPase subunit